MIYEYKCSHCDLVFEVQQKMSDPSPAKCPDEESHIDGDPLHSYKLERVISRTSFQLKGSGFYSTDYKKRPSPNE